ncbi:MAG: hypothetical protein HGA45_05720 [Chloroflexales bacterium]|nr:hypothetical protein [Chloroflexales bacterium]
MSRQKPRGRGLSWGVNSLQAGLARADTLITAGQLADAVAVLAELDTQFRDNPEVLLRTQ